MINNKIKKYIFIKNLNEKIKKNIKKLNNVQIIYNNEDFNNISIKQLIEIRDFCLKNKIPLYIINNYKIALKIKADGIFISSNNRNMMLSPFLNQKLKTIGSAHNQIEYYFKRIQRCRMITLSPIFYNPKYSNNKILNTLRFSLISKDWKTNLCALGGITKRNLNRINLINVSAIAFQRMILEET
jgi:thiamine-phosphate pyrophosphorylase